MGIAWNTQEDLSKFTSRTSVTPNGALRLLRSPQPLLAGTLLAAQATDSLAWRYNHWQHSMRDIWPSNVDVQTIMRLALYITLLDDLAFFRSLAAWYPSFFIIFWTPQVSKDLKIRLFLTFHLWFFVHILNFYLNWYSFCLLLSMVLLSPLLFLSWLYVDQNVLLLVPDAASVFVLHTCNQADLRRD